MRRGSRPLCDKDGPLHLGLDIGTSGVKAVLLDGSGQAAQQATAPLAASHPRPLWSEQDPDAWWAATQAAVLQLDARLRASVRGVGLAGQMHGAVLLDQADRVLRPAILWNDGRAGAECEELEAAEPRSRAITGNRALAGFTAPKLLWVRRHEPEIWRALRTVLLPKDHVRLRMTGGKATDMSDASGTLWLDVAARRWSPAMLAATGLDEAAMPALHEGPEVTGGLRPEVAAAWGVPARTPVAAGGGDNAAAAVGLGVVDAGDGFLSLGTSGVIFAAGRAPAPAPQSAVHAFAHALPGRWHQMSVMLSAAASIDWAARLLGFADAATLVAEAGRAPAGAGGVTFLPYLAGERTPHGDPLAKGVLHGLNLSADRAGVARAVLEGVAMGLRDGLDALRAAGGAPAALRLAGGGSRSPFLARLVASALETPLELRRDGDMGPALGAARLARLATEGADDATLAPPPLLDTTAPDPALVAAFAERQPRFRRLYRDLRESFRTAA